MQRGGSFRSISSAISMPGYVRKKTLNPGGRTECTRVRVKGKSYDVGCGIQFSTWNITSMSRNRGKYLTL